jgi:hypothetical protein
MELVGARSRGNGNGQAEGGKGGKKHGFHRSSPSSSGEMSGFDDWKMGLFTLDDNPDLEDGIYASHAEI